VIVNKKLPDKPRETVQKFALIMVSAQNGDQNGHVLVENQQTRLNADNETPEATSKSKVYR
jgi:hypothetical protein